MTGWAWTFLIAWALAEWHVVVLLRERRRDTSKWAMLVEGAAA